MSDEQKEKLIKRVMEFVKEQEGYDPATHEKLKAFCENKNTWAVTYGDDIVKGIAGFGETPEKAFEDFVRSWNYFKGFEWIKYNKSGLHHWGNKE